MTLAPRRSALVAGTLALSLLIPTAAFAAPTPEQVEDARKHYDAGLQLTREESYEAALSEFERAYQIAPNYRILYNVGGLRRQLNDFVGALKALEQYLAEGGSALEASRVAEVQQDIASLRSRVGRVRVEVAVDDVEIRVDGVVVGRSPLTEPILMNPGRRKIEGIKTEWFPASSVVVVTGGETGTARLEMTKLSAEQDKARVRPAEKATTTTTSTRSPHKIPALVGWGVTAGLTAGAAITGILALDASSSLKDERTSPTPSRATLDSEQDKTKTFALVSDIFVIGAVVSAGVSTYFTVRWLGGSTSSPVTVGVGPTSLSFGKTW